MFLKKNTKNLCSLALIGLMLVSASFWQIASAQTDDDKKFFDRVIENVANLFSSGETGEAGASNADDVNLAPPSNDTFAGAVAITVNSQTAGTLGSGADSAVNDYQLAAPGTPTCFSGNGANTASTAPGRDVVYSFTAPAAGNYSFRVQSRTTTAGGNLVIYLVSGTPTGAAPIDISCQATGGTPPVAFAAANRNAVVALAVEELYNIPLTASQQVFLVVDEFAAGTAINDFFVEAFRTTTETEPNDTFAAAQAPVFGIEGTISNTAATQDADYFTVGTPADGSRLFAIVDGAAADSSDFDLRVNNAASTFQYSDAQNDAENGGLAPNIAGLPLAAADGPYAMQVDWFGTTNTAAHEPYRLAYVVQPPISAATTEAEPNETNATAQSATNNYFSGTFSSVTDVDVYATAANAGDLLFVSLDNDPGRDGNNPNGNFELLDGAGNVIFTLNDASIATTAGFAPVAGQIATTPIAPSEANLFRIPTTNVYYIRVLTTSFNATGPNNYLLSVSKNGAVGGGGTSLPGAGTVQFSSATFSGNEGTTATITVTRTGGNTGAITVNYATSSGSATGGASCGAGVDFINASGTLSFANGELSRTFTVQLCPDATLEPQETVNLTLSNPAGGATLGTPAAAVLTINDIPPPFTGAFNVGTGQTFTSLTNPGGIFEAINTGGATGNVIINIASDLTGETGAIALNEIAGGFTLTIKPSGAARSITGSTAATTGLIRLLGADNVTIDGSLSGGTDRSLTINQTGTGAIIIIGTTGTNGSNNNTVKNTILIGAPSSQGIIAGSGTTLGGAGTAPQSNNTIQNNIIRGVQNAAFISGAPATDQNWSITDNQVGGTAAADKLSFRGFILINSTNLTISRNLIRGISSQPAVTVTMSGIQVAGIINGGTIARNEITDIRQNNPTGFGSNGIFSTATSTASNLLIANNFISDIASQGTGGVLPTSNGYGIVMSSGGGYNIYFNSVNMNANQVNPASITAALNVAAAVPAGAIDLRNNILANTQTVGTRYGAYVAATAGAAIFSTINYNDYFAQNVGFLTTARPTLADWQMATGQDANSRAVDPLFVSATNLHLQPTSPLINAGIPIAAVTDDFDGQPRPATGVDIGADEVVGGGGTPTPTPTVTPTATPTATPTVTPTPVAELDLTISQSDAPDPVTVGQPLTYTLTVTIFPTAIGGSASPVVRFNFPSGVPFTFNSASGTNGYTATADASGVTFTGGVVSTSGVNPGTATLTVTITPLAAGLLTSAGGNVVVDPNNAISESNENNNTAQTITTITTPTPGNPNVDLFGLRAGNQLVRFNAGLVGNLIVVGTITGLQPGENILAIDFRPATGQLFGLGSSSRLYIINRTTAAATAVGGQFSTLLNGTNFGFDFNPTVDRIRVVSDTGQNLRLNPNDGAVTVDGNLNPGAPQVTAAAYTNSFGVAATTTLYVIDSAINLLLIQSNPNAGTLTEVGPLGVDFQPINGFDIASNNIGGNNATTNIAFAVTSNLLGSPQLYTINLATGAATFIGNIGGPGMTIPFRGLSAATSGPRPATNVLDFNGDRRADYAVYRFSTGTVFASRGDGNLSLAFPFGIPGDDIFTPGDYDGDGRTDIAVWRSSTGVFFVFRSSDNTTIGFQFGAPGDEPVARDYDGDGRTDYAVVRRAGGVITWFIRNSSNGAVTGTNFGAASDTVVPGDYDGDGRFDLAVFRGNGPTQAATFFVRQSSNGAVTAFNFGLGSDLVVPGDYDGDGRTDYAVVRTGTAYDWYILRSSDGALQYDRLGRKSSLPVQNDYDGDGRTDVAVYDPATGTFFVRRSTDFGLTQLTFGQNGDYPIANFDTH